MAQNAITERARDGEERQGSLALSVIVPSFNSSQTIERCIRGLLGQDIPAEDFEIQFAGDLGIPRWSHMSMKYEITELSTAVKPFFLEKLFTDLGADKVIYLDPDILVYRPLDQVIGLLDDHGVVLTPHILEPLADDKNPSELDFLRVGTYNLGFLALSRQGPWKELLPWGQIPRW